MNLIEESPESIEIKDSLERAFNISYYTLVCLQIFTTLLLISLGITSIFVFSSTSGFVGFLALTIILDMIFFFGIHNLNSTQKPIYRVKITLTKKKIEIFIQDHSFREYLWSEIEKVIITRESFTWFDKRFRIDLGGRYWQKHFRPDVFRLSKQNTKLLAQSLEEFSTSLHKEYIVRDEIQKGDNEERLKEFLEVEDFREKFIEKKNTVKHTSYERRFRFFFNDRSSSLEREDK
ncbi:MAG: hypothetical protein ACFE96_13590 [Candidatus Hermodarchaeota archaeon]